MQLLLRCLRLTVFNVQLCLIASHLPHFSLFLQTPIGLEVLYRYQSALANYVANRAKI